MEQLRSNHQKLALCAKLSKFAYTSANPGASISIDDEKAKAVLRKNVLGLAHDSQADHFERFASKSWWHQNFETQKRWFRSQSFFYRYDDPTAKVSKIIVAFRGTWNDPSAEREWKQVTKDSTVRWYQRISSGVYNFFMREFPPSNIGLSDFYYDAFLIRTPYTEGTIWKWYAYWGSLVLERTSHPLLSKLFAHSRIVAANWLSTPNSDRIGNAIRGDVHLGFWSLWASPEGFAGYAAEPGEDGEPSLIDKPRILSRIRKAVERSRQEGWKTEITVVGHSLGGAVSSFAALDLVKVYRADRDVSIFHASFGAPPVGTPQFQAYYNSHFNEPEGRHESWAIYHRHDLVAHIFAWCGSWSLASKFGWWGDWRRVGKQVMLTSLIPSAPSVPAGQPTSATAKSLLRRLRSGISQIIFWPVLGAGVITGMFLMYVASLVAVPVAAVRYWFPGCRYDIARPPTKWGTGRSPIDHLATGQTLSLDYHSLQTYIDIIEQDQSCNIVQVTG